MNYMQISFFLVYVFLLTVVVVSAKFPSGAVEMLRVDRHNYDRINVCDD